MSTDADSGGTPSSSDYLRQEIRFAVVMTGGVSLAIWMGGVARELNLLLHRGSGASELAQRVQAGYQRLLDLLSVDVRVDVLSGTSAGGINSAILGLANVHGADIGSLRELWLTEGAFGSLLRNPKQPPPIPSLLQGDDQLLAGLRKGLQAIASSPGDGDVANPRPTDVFITTTLLDGEPSRFVDDYGTLVSDVDHHGLFHFDADQLTGETAAQQLALAGRCTASFPLAFEPAHLTIGAASVDSTHPDMTNLSNATKSCYVADGGLLANRPIAAAVRAVFDEPANCDVRRVLLYVVPTAAPTAIPDDDMMPPLGAALLKDLSAMTSQAITADLAGIRAHNETVQVRLDAYRQLAAIANRVPGSLVDRVMYQQYRDSVADDQAGLLVDEVLRQQSLAALQLDEDDTLPSGGSPGEQTSQLRASVTAGLAADLPAAVPASGDFEALGQLGRRGYDAAKTIALDLIRRAYQASPTPAQRQQLAQARGDVHNALPPPPAASEDLIGIVANALGDRPLGTSLAAAWAEKQQTPAELAEGWRRLAAAMTRAASLLATLLGAEDPMLSYLGRDAATFAIGMARLHIAHTVLLPSTPLADQPLELIQVSADTATDLDSRNQATEKLTGLQLHHFGAFYKFSWRANDWMWGRLDGAGWLVHALLDPRRLRTLRRLDNDPASYAQRLSSGLSVIANATAPGGPGHDAGTAATTIPPAAQHELDALWQEDSPPPTSLPETAKWVAAGIQRIILEEELPCVAEQIGVDEAAGASVNAAAQAFLAAMRDPSADAKSQLAACQVSSETLAGEAHSRLYAATVKHTALVTVAALESSGKTPAFVKPALTTMRAELELIPGGLLVRAGDFIHRLRHRDSQ
jgi:predicted acylesterase/phospholipase RssA